MSALAIRPVAFAEPDVQTLVAEVQQEYVARYGGPDQAPLETGAFDAPLGAFFVGYEVGRPVAMGGWRIRGDVHPWGRLRAAEVKRMYVVPTARGRGHARAMLAHLERTALLAGADVIVLETGTAQPEAIALYTSAGYQQIENYGYYADSPLSRCFGKRL
jgi:ribosomal protein S18 acetylase RimI-like enzyme